MTSPNSVTLWDDARDEYDSSDCLIGAAEDTDWFFRRSCISVVSRFRQGSHLLALVQTVLFSFSDPRLLGSFVPGICFLVACTLFIFLAFCRTYMEYRLQLLLTFAAWLLRFEVVHTVVRFVSPPIEDYLFFSCFRLVYFYVEYRHVTSSISSCRCSCTVRSRRTTFFLRSTRHFDWSNTPWFTLCSFRRQRPPCSTTSGAFSRKAYLILHS